MLESGNRLSAAGFSLDGNRLQDVKNSMTPSPVSLGKLWSDPREGEAKSHDSHIESGS